jgi:hypothetical protein
MPRLDTAANALMLADWLQMDNDMTLLRDEDAVATFKCFQALARSIHNARAEYNAKQGKKIGATVVALGRLKDAIKAEMKLLVLLANLDPDRLSFLEAGSDGAKEATAGNLVQLIVQDRV